jgi:hypothetical protein
MMSMRVHRLRPGLCGLVPWALLACGVKSDEPDPCQPDVRGLNGGDSSFELPESESIVTAGDFDGDGNIDLALGDIDTREGSTVAVHYGPIDHDSVADLTILLADDHANLGWRMASGGDLSGDGFDDLAILDLAWSDELGWASTIHIVASPFRTLDDLPAQTQAVIDIEGEDFDYDVQLAFVGDLDADGIEEFALGYRPMNSAPLVGIYPGPIRGRLTPYDAPIQVVGMGSVSGFESTIAPAGDVNGDGLGDLLLCDPYMQNAKGSSGAAVVLHGPLASLTDVADAGGQIVSGSDDPYAGAAVAGDVDLDGDGLDDLIVTAPGGTTSSRVYLFLSSRVGGLEGVIEAEAADAVLWGENEEDDHWESNEHYYSVSALGRSVTGLRDLDQDGLDDFAVSQQDYLDGYMYYSNGSAFWVVTEPIFGGHRIDCVETFKLRGNMDEDVSHALADPGDVDGDGVTDLLISSLRRSWVVFGGELID